MASKQSFDSTHFSDSDRLGADDEKLLGYKPKPKTRKAQALRKWIFSAANIFILLINIGLVLMISVPKHGTVSEDNGDAHLPHADWIAPAIELELRTFDDKFRSGTNPFRGVPRPELDAAWHDLVKHYALRIPSPGWQKATSPSNILTEFQDEKGGMMGSFGYLHNLHCLKVIREYLQPDHYPEIAAAYKPPPGKPLHQHFDHCIEMLRQSELCHADLSLTQFEWHENMDDPTIINHQSEHVCKNTQKLNEFIKANTVHLLDPILVNPWTGKQPYQGSLRKEKNEIS